MFDLKLVVFLVFIGFLLAQPNHAVSPPKCSKPMDILFLVDKSGSLSKWHFDLEKQIIGNIIGSFDVSSSAAKVSLVLFANKVHPVFCFNDHTTQESLQKAVASLECPECEKGDTVTGHALKWGREKSFTETCGARSNVNKFVIILTDGKSTENKRYLNRQITKMKRTGAYIFGIGVGKKIKTSEVEHLTSHSEMAFTIKSFNEVPVIMEATSTKVCEIKELDPIEGDAERKQVFRKSMEDGSKLQSVTVIGSFITSEKSFSSNFLAGNWWTDGVVFHLVVRHDRAQDGKPYLLMDSKKDVWLAAEQFYLDSNAFDAGNKFTLKYQIKEEQIKVYLNGGYIADYNFKQSYSADDLKTFKISGDIKVESVCFRTVGKLDCYGADLPEGCVSLN